MRSQRKLQAKMMRLSIRISQVAVADAGTRNWMIDIWLGLAKMMIMNKATMTNNLGLTIVLKYGH